MIGRGTPKACRRRAKARYPNPLNFFALSVRLVLEHRLDLFPQFRRVLVPVNGGRMLRRRVEHFFFGAGNFERAMLFARVIPAIDGFSLRHNMLL